jgi:tetratricopeptide (TPR) repeat protein
VAVGLLLASLLAAGSPGTDADPLAAFDQALAAAESGLRAGDLAGAENHYRDALVEGWTALGAVRRLEGRPSQASAAFAQAARLVSAETPRQLDTRRRLVRALAAEGKTEQALAALDAAGGALADDPESVFLLATEYLWLKKVDRAEGLFAKLLEARPLPQTRVLVGRTYRDAGEYDRARAELRAALAQDPKVHRAHYYLGMVTLADARTGPDRLDRAIAEFRAELALDPQDPLAGDQLGLALLEAGRPAEALPCLEAAVRAERRSLYLHHLGQVQLALDRPSDAAATLRDALALAEKERAGAAELEKIHYQLGLALRKTGAADEAASHLAEAGRLAAARNDASRDEPSPLAELSGSDRQQVAQRVTAGLARAYSNLGIIQAQAGRFSEAAELFEQAGSLDPGFPRLAYSLGIAYFNAREYAKAVGPLGRALEGDPTDAALKRMLALASLESGAYARAAELLKDDPQLASDPSLQFAYGLVLVRSERAAEAQEIFSRLVKEHGDSAEMWVLLGQAQAQQGDYPAATAALQRALGLKPEVAEAQGTLGLIHLKQGHFAEAETALRAELKAHPEDLVSQQNLAVVLESLQRREEAIALLEGMLAKKPDLSDARYLLGKALLAQGKAAEALEQLQQAAKLAPEDPAVHYQLGQAYQKLGRGDEAQQEFERFRTLKARQRKEGS